MIPQLVLSEEEKAERNLSRAEKIRREHPRCDEFSNYWIVAGELADERNARQITPGLHVAKVTAEEIIAEIERRRRMGWPKGKKRGPKKKKESEISVCSECWEPLDAHAESCSQYAGPTEEEQADEAAKASEGLTQEEPKSSEDLTERPELSVEEPPTEPSDFAETDNPPKNPTIEQVFEDLDEQFFLEGNKEVKNAIVSREEWLVLRNEIVSLREAKKYDIREIRDRRYKLTCQMAEVEKELQDIDALLEDVTK